MDKKFLSLEEAATLFGIDPKELQRLVDEGELRALADRGSWKYHRGEIEQLIKSGLLSAKPPEDDFGDGLQQTLEFDSSEKAEGEGRPEDLAFLELDEEALADGATMVRQAADLDADENNTTPSDIKLVKDDKLEFASDSEILLVESDADVPVSKLPPSLPPEDVPVAESLSEFDLATGSSLLGKSASDSGKSKDSSVIVGGDDSKIESDSDVQVVAESTSDSGITSASDSGITLGAGEPASGINPTDSDVRVADSGLTLEPADSGISLEADSGITLEASGVFPKGSSTRADDSGITLEADSGLEMKPDSGISLEADSGLTMEVDSGIALEAAADSGISLEGSDSGLSLDDGDSGIALAGKQKSAGRAPRPDDTLAEIDQTEDEEFLQDSSDQTAMIALDDDDNAAEMAPAKKGKKAKAAGLSGAFDTADEVEELEIVDDLDAGELDVDAADDDEIEDVLEASDEAFTMEESGEASEASIASMPSFQAVYKEPSWGIGAVLPAAACALLLLVQALIVWDGMATMWNGETSQAISASIIDALGGML